MFSQKLHAAENIEFGVAEELRYETDPCELKLDEMIEAEPEPEMIEGLPASDALTPADRYLELFEHACWISPLIISSIARTCLCACCCWISLPGASSVL